MARALSSTLSPLGQTRLSSGTVIVGGAALCTLVERLQQAADVLGEHVDLAASISGR